jgi:cytochrome bd-type quinol oxidase subunit 1
MKIAFTLAMLAASIATAAGAQDTSAIHEARVQKYKAAEQAHKEKLAAQAPAVAARKTAHEQRVAHFTAARQAHQAKIAADAPKLAARKAERQTRREALAQQEATRRARTTH